MNGMMVGTAALLALVTVAEASADNRWVHDWSTTSAMTFADYRDGSMLTDAQATDVASKFRIVSLEKCTGVSSLNTEEAIYSTAKQLKSKDPTIKVLFYWPMDQQALHCYDAYKEFKNHPEWHLKLDNGAFVEQNGEPVMDPTIAGAGTWWVSVPLGGINGTGLFEGTPVSSLIDGVLADSGNYKNVGNRGISTARKERISDANRALMGRLQAAFTTANGGIVMANGVDMYPSPNQDPRYVDDRTRHYNLIALEEAGAIMGEHTAVFESVNALNNSLKVETVAQNLQALVDAAHFDGGSKAVFVQTWPGLYVGTKFSPHDGIPAHVYPSYHGCTDCEPTPQSMGEWRDALRRHFEFAHALFLSIAEPNMYFMYGGYWYGSNTGYIACPKAIDTCACPPEWYPDLKKPLGPPLGPRKLVAPYVWTREFKYAKVRLDLLQRNNTRVIFSGP